MYLATKNGGTCRIPDGKAPYYKALGYKLESLNPVPAPAVKKRAKNDTVNEAPDKATS